jgi:drug/metabolite transporter (DMT)-like permease
MGSSAGDAATESLLPGSADTARPGGGVWLTDASLVLVAIIWGVNFSIVKFGTSLIDPLAFNGVRVLLAGVLLFAIALASRIKLPSAREIAILLALGVLGNGVYQVFFVEGVARTRASDAGLVIAASPAFIAIVGRMFGVERVSARGVMGILLSIGGIAFVVLGTTNATAGDATLVGDFLVLTGSLCWAFYTVMLKPYTERLSGLHVAAFTMLGGAIPLFLLALPRIAATHWAQLPVKGWSAILYSGVFALVVAYLFWYRGVRVIGPTRTAMYSNLQPVVAVLIAWWLLGETPTWWQGVGTGCIVGGLLLTRT